MIPVIVHKIVPVIETMLNCFGKNTQLHPLQDAICSMQLCIYWLKAADKELGIVEEEDNTISHGTAILPVAKRQPTLLGMPDYFDFLTSKLREVSKDIQDYSEESALPPSVLYKVNRGYDRLMEALFNTELANNYYGQLSGR